jgi:hypothetical protein
MMSGPAEMGPAVFRYPIGVRLGYPLCFLVWVLLPVLPVMIWSAIGWTEGTTYRFALDKYYGHPWVVLIFGSMWLWAVYMLYIANLDRAEIRIQNDLISRVSMFGTRTISWSCVKGIVKRHQAVKGKELRTFFINATSKRIVFSDGLINADKLLARLNLICAANNIPLFYEDYQTRPIVKLRIPTL